MESPRPSKKRKTQVRFDDADDDALLKEILAVNPFQVERGGKTAAWAKVAVSLALDVDARCCRERCTLMLSEFKVKMAKSAAASGIDEEHTEKDDLLANVLELFEDAEALRDEKKQKKEAKQQDNERADAMRDEAMNGMGKRKNKYDSFTELMAHVKERDEFSRAVELRKVANEENRLVLERERLALEKEDKNLKLKLPLRESSGLGTAGCAINAIASSARMTPNRLAARTVSSSSILTGRNALNSVTGSILTIHLIYTLGLLNFPRCY